MRTDYTSTRTLEIETGDNGHTVDIDIGLHCTVASFPGCFSPVHGGEPPHGPEFEVTTIAVEVPAVNTYRFGKPLPSSYFYLSYDHLCALYGSEAVDKLIEDARSEEHTSELQSIM